MPYRLILDHADWDHLRHRLADPFFAGLAKTNRRALDLIRQHPRSAGPVRTRLDDPTSPPTTIPWRVHKVQLVRGAVAWWCDRRADDAEDLCTVIDEILDEDWKVPSSLHAIGIKRFDLRSGDLAWSAAFAIDTLPEVIGATRVAALTARLANELLPYYLAGVAEGEWWSACDFNWGSATHGNAGFAALALADTHPELSRQVLVTARIGLESVIAAFPADGGWIEGLMYQTTAIAHLTDFVAALYRVTGDDLGLSTNPRFLACLRHRQEQLGGDGRPINFSNNNEHNIEWRMNHPYWWANRLNEPAITAFLDAHQKPWGDTHGLFHDVEAFWYRQPFQTSQVRPTASFHHFSGLDWLAWRGPRWWLAVRGGQLGGNHGNQDLGQLIVGTGAQRWLLDPGYGASSTARHNLPTIRGFDQADAARGPIVRRTIGEDIHIAVDLHETHPHVLDRWIRHILVLDGTLVVLIDDLLSRGGRRLSLRFHLQVRGDVAIAGERVTLRQGDATVGLIIPGPHLGIDREAWTWANQPITDLSWRPAPDAPQTVQAVCLGELNADVHIDHQAETSVIRFNGRSWRLQRSALSLARIGA